MLLSGRAGAAQDRTDGVGTGHVSTMWSPPQVPRMCWHSVPTNIRYPVRSPPPRQQSLPGWLRQGRATRPQDNTGLICSVGLPEHSLHPTAPRLQPWIWQWVLAPPARGAVPSSLAVAVHSLVSPFFTVPLQLGTRRNGGSAGRSLRNQIFLLLRTALRGLFALARRGPCLSPFLGTPENAGVT